MAPTQMNQTFFFTNLFLTLASLPGEYIITGDWNCTLDPNRDRSTRTDQTHNKCRLTIHPFIKELNLLDIRRYLNPNGVAYSCHSLTFKTYSRIDYFLVLSTLIYKIHKCYYDSISISDHGLCCLIYTDANLLEVHLDGT